MMSPDSNDGAATADTGSSAVSASKVNESSSTAADSVSSSTGSENVTNNGGFFPTVSSGSPCDLQVGGVRSVLQYDKSLILSNHNMS